MNKSIYQLINEAASSRPTRAANLAALRAAATKEQNQKDARKAVLEADFRKRGLHENKPDLPGIETDSFKLSSYYEKLHGFMEDAAKRGREHEDAAFAVVGNHGVGHHLSRETGRPHELITGLVRAKPEENHMGTRDYP